VRQLRLILILAFASFAFGQAKQSKVAAAYASEQNIIVLDSSANIVRKIAIPFAPIGLGIAPDGTQLIATKRTFGRGMNGGDFFLWTTRRPVWVKITHGPYAFKQREKGYREVYADPAFSPTGRRIAFAIHWESLGDDNDVVMASGPLAIMDIATRRIEVIRATNEVYLKEPAYANTPVWSPDGTRILMNFEVGCGMVDVSNGTLTDPGKKTTESLAACVGWKNERSILFTTGKDSDEYAKFVTKILDISSNQIVDTSIAIGTKQDELKGLHAWTTRAMVREMDSKRVLIVGRQIIDLSIPDAVALAPVGHGTTD
jgi:hypothetical protein